MKTLLTILALTLPLFAGEKIEYPAGSVTAHGYLALPEGASAEKPAPGVIVIHEWWGHNDYARSRADQLAALGYAALAIDMYGEGKTTTHPKDAGSFASEATSKLPVMKERFLAGMKTLQDRPEVDPSKIATLGYCMGGMISLQMAALNLDNLLGAASFHGALNIDFPKDVTPLKAALLVCHGEDDSFIPADVISSFKEAAKARNAKLTFESYPGAVHGFTNPGATALGKEHGINIAYHQEADEKSWASLKTFLSETFSN
ncbi:MAG: dienelactone hydrolase family protein [Verrucomicrobiota bacterium]